MADTVTNLSLITLAQAFRGDIVRQINRMTMLLKLVKITAGEGKNVAFATEAGGALAESYTEGADAANFQGDSQDQCILTWGLSRSNFHLTQLAMDAAATTATPAGNRALWARNLVNAATKLASFINGACFNGAGTSGLIFGLDGAIGSTSNIYGSIDRSQAGNAYFRPTVVDPGAPTSPTMKSIRDDLRLIYEACGENPDVAIATPQGLNKVASLFDATRRQVDQMQTARGVIRLDFGYAVVEVDGTMFVKDKDATANGFYYLNTNHVELQVLPTAGAMSALPQHEVEADDGFGPVPLGMDYEMIAKLGASERAMVRSTCQLVVTRPNACGKRVNVDQT